MSLSAEARQKAACLSSVGGIGDEGLDPGLGHVCIINGGFAALIAKAQK